MTNIKLIKMLLKHPFQAVVFIHDPDQKGLAPVTGCITGPDPTQGNYVIELYSDDIP